MAGSRTVKIEILGDARSAQGAFGAVGGAADSFGSRIGGIAKTAGLALAGIGVAAGAAAVVGIRAASDYEQAWGKVDDVFHDQAKRIQDWSKGSAQAFGLSRGEALETAGTFGNLFTSMGITTEQSADMSTGIVKLASDLGAFNNLGTAEVLQKIQSGLVGQSEPLRSVGINLDAVQIAQKAVNMGLIENVKDLTPATKAQAAYALMLEQSVNATDNFAETRNSMENSLQVIKASFQDLKVELGQKLLPIIAPLIAAFSHGLPIVIERTMQVVDALVARFKGPVMAAFVLARDGVLTFIQALQGNWSDNENIRGFHRVIGMIGTVIREQVIPAVQTMVAWFTGTLIPAAQQIIGIIGQVTAAFGEGGFAGVLAMLAERLSPIAQQLATWAGQVLVQIVNSLGQWAGAFLDWIAPMIPPLLVELGVLMGQLVSWIYGTALPAIAAQLATWGQALIDWIGPRVGPMLSALGDLLTQLGSWAVDTALPAIAEKVGQWGAAFIAWVGPQIGPLLSALGGLLAELGGWLIGTALPAIAEKLSQWGQAFIAWVGPQIPPLLVALGGLLGELAGWLVNTALPKIVEKLAEWGAAFIGWVASDVLPKLPGALAAILTTIGEWAVGAAGAIAAIGADLIRGLIAGIGSMAGAAASAVVDVFKGAFEAGKNWLLSRSPSRRAADELGLPIAQGIAIGIGDGAGDVQASMLQLASDALGAGRSALQATGAEIATSLLEGFTREGSSRDVSAWAGLFSADVARALDEMRQTAEKNLRLGQIAGEDTAELQQALDDILALIGAFESQVGSTMSRFMDGAQIGQAVADQWMDLLGNLGGILDGSVQRRLGDTLAGLERQMRFALAGGAPEDVIAGLQGNIDAVQQQLAIAEQALATSGAAGLVESAFQIPLDRLPALMASMEDGGLSMVGKLVEGIASGATDIDGVMSVLAGVIAAGSDKLPETIGASVDDIIGTLSDLEKQLTVDLANAFIAGTDPSGIEANLAAIGAMLSDLEAQADATARSIKGVNSVTGQVIRPPGDGGSSSGSRSFNARDVAAGTVRLGQSLTLMVPDGRLITEYYAYEQQRAEVLSPVGIGG